MRLFHSVAAALLLTLGLACLGLQLLALPLVMAAITFCWLRADRDPERHQLYHSITLGLALSLLVLGRLHHPLWDGGSSVLDELGLSRLPLWLNPLLCAALLLAVMVKLRLPLLFGLPLVLISAIIPGMGRRTGADPRVLCRQSGADDPLGPAAARLWLALLLQSGAHPDDQILAAAGLRYPAAGCPPAAHHLRGKERLMKPVTRQLALLLSGLAILAGINATVWRYEYAMSSGEVVLLRLAPVDPRSLMQGDYMRLNYEIARELTSRDARATQDKGSDTLVIRLDAHQVASLVADGKPDRLASDERLLQVHQSERQWQIGPDAYFFEEGTGSSTKRPATVSSGCKRMARPCWWGCGMRPTSLSGRSAPAGNGSEWLFTLFMVTLKGRLIAKDVPNEDMADLSSVAALLGLDGPG